ncbi:MAG: hypothetical protein HY700_10005 [Gemmatimonadetes bacterium]|nr:hypothetical protein [Gemmatimonadota bacterium]
MRTKPLIAGLLLAATPACMATYRVSPTQYVPEKSPARMVVQDKAGLLYVLEQPVIVGENLTGIQAGTPDTISLPVSRVEAATVRKKSPARTALLVGTMAVIAGAVAIETARGGHGESCKLLWDQLDIPGKDSDCAPLP